MLDDRSELARFVHDEHGIIGVFRVGGEPVRFIDRLAAFDEAVKRKKLARPNFRRG
jgi:hypothetical protein